MTSGGSGERLGNGQFGLAPLIGRGDWKSKKKRSRGCCGLGKMLRIAWFGKVGDWYRGCVVP